MELQVRNVILNILCVMFGTAIGYLVTQVGMFLSSCCRLHRLILFRQLLFAIFLRRVSIFVKCSQRSHHGVYRFMFATSFAESSAKVAVVILYRSINLLLIKDIIIGPNTLPCKTPAFRLPLIIKNHSFFLYYLSSLAYNDLA